VLIDHAALHIHALPGEPFEGLSRVCRQQPLKIGLRPDRIELHGDSGLRQRRGGHPGLFRIPRPAVYDPPEENSPVPTGGLGRVTPRCRILRADGGCRLRCQFRHIATCSC
jgi:hypothetical protein